jgi:hypothetical protein
MLSLSPSPTFQATVEIPQLGEAAAPLAVRFTFKHRTRDEFAALLKSEDDPAAAQRADEQVVMDVACGWELVEEFSVENVRTFCQHFHGAATSVVRTYLREFAKARLGN